MKNLMFVILTLISFSAFSQTSPKINFRSSSAVTVSDARLRAQLNMYVPHQYGLHLNGGLDSLGGIFYDDSSRGMWFRDTVTSVGHQYTSLISSATNGLTKSGIGVKLGGTFNSHTILNQSGFNLTLMGGGQVIFDSTRHTQTYTNPTLLSDSLVTFGNSITAGLNASVTDSTYVNRIAAYYGLPLTNKGVSSTVAYQACASNLAYINPGHAAMVTFCIGINDFRNNGGGANMYRGVKNAYEAAMVNQFLASYTAASSCTVTGSWTTGYNAVVNAGGKTTGAAYSSSAGADITKVISGTSVAVGLVGQYSNARNAEIYIDGVLVETVVTNNQTFAAGTGYQAMARYYTGLSVGSHTVKVVVGSGSGFVMLDYIGTMVDAANMQPFVLVHVPHMDATGYAAGNATQAIIDAGNDSLTAIYNRAFAAGLNVYLARTNTYYNASTTSGLSSDHIHPNDLGMYQFFSAIRNGLSSAVAIPGSLKYSNDGHFYGTKIDGTLNQIPYTSEINLQRALTNGSYLTGPNYVSGTNTLDFQSFTRISMNKFKVDNGITAVMEGTIGVIGANGSVFVGERNSASDTTKGFLFYTSGTRTRQFDTWNNVDVTTRDTSFRVLFRNNKVNNVLATPSATVHITGSDGIYATGHASLKIDSGALLAIPEKYAIEVDGDLYFTGNNLVRYKINKPDAKYVVGTSTNDNATTGNIGENVESYVSTYTNYTTTATYQNIASITLTAGDWDIDAQGTFYSNGATIIAANDAIFLIGTVTASATGSLEGKSIGYVSQAALLGTSHQSVTIAPYRVSIASTTTYYLNTQSSFTVGNPQFVGGMHARRSR